MPYKKNQGVCKKKRASSTDLAEYICRRIASSIYASYQNSIEAHLSTQQNRNRLITEKKYIIDRKRQKGEGKKIYQFA